MKRTSLQLCLALCGLVLALHLSAPAAHAAPGRQPNILVIFSDDQGWRDTGYNGEGYIETPNLDRLAKEGMVFTSGYASAGNCQPSRGCLYSGTYTPRHYVFAVASTDRGPKQLQRMIPIPNKSGLPVENITLGDAMKAGGYATGHFGKWHLGSGPEGTSPAQQGFDVVMDGPHQNAPKDPKSVYKITDAACEFMEKNKDKPFFCFVSHHAIHSKVEARDETLAKFKAKSEKVDSKISPVYAACMYDLDDGVGILLKKLADLGLEKDTLVLYTSDNGGTNASPQEPLRGNKGGYYEGGIREPFIVRWAGVVKAGSKCDVPVINIDLYPTFLDAAGIKVPAGKVLDGESIVPLLKQTGDSGGLKRKAIFWHFPGYLDRPVIRGRDPVFRTRPVSVIRKGDWKLHLYHEEWQLDGGRGKLDTNNAVELYNLIDDIGERKNLANANKMKRDELLDDLLAWFKATDAPLPTEKNPKYDSEAEGNEKKGKKNKNK
ncbi:MAG: sulfatase [Phycisphaeraceae bacterium]